MHTEALLAFFHFAAIGTMVIFIAAQAAVCLPSTFNAAVVRQLARLDLIVGVAALAVWATGLARVY